MPATGKTCNTVAIGASAGGMEALTILFSYLTPEFPASIIVVQHIHPTNNGYFSEYYERTTALKVKEANDKEAILPGVIYLAPPNYHLLVERDRIFSLSVDAKVNFARPSIDVTFESAAYAIGGGLIGIILTGANHDGAEGIRAIKANGGLTIAQDPATAEHPVMPEAAISTGMVDRILSIEKIGELLNSLG